MRTKEKLEIINAKLDLSLRAISIIPLFIASVNSKDPKRQWKSAVKQWEEIDKKYTDILKYEVNHNTTSVEDQVS